MKCTAIKSAIHRDWKWDYTIIVLFLITSIRAAKNPD
jgi:hypothetical protein